MSRQTVRRVGGLVVVLVLLWVAFAMAMRTEFQPVQDAVRRMNRSVLNPRTMETAGQPGDSASVVQHFGRTTGTPYETPVQAVATKDGFVIALPYGTRADLLRNVLDAGSAVIVNDGNSYQVDQPELVPIADGNPHFPTKDQRSHRLYGVDHCLQVRRVDGEESQEQTT